MSKEPNSHKRKCILVQRRGAVLGPQSEHSESGTLRLYLALV